MNAVDGGAITHIAVLSLSIGIVRAVRLVGVRLHHSRWVCVEKSGSLCSMKRPRGGEEGWEWIGNDVLK